MRPGEKLFEELFIAGEVYGRTAHQKIFVADNGAGGGAGEQGSRGAEEQGSGGAREGSSALTANLDELIAAAQRDETGEVRRLLRAVVPEYGRG